MDARQTVEEDLEVRLSLEERSDEVKVEYLFHVVNIIRDRVYDLDFQRAVFLGANRSYINIRNVLDLVRCEGLGLLEDLVCNRLGCWCLRL